MNSTELFKFWIKQGWLYRCRQRPELLERKVEYSRRVSYEFKIIHDKNFEDYFLVVSDLIRWAKENNITVGPGRGSSAGSLICYLLRITEIDPLHPTFDKMIFERFLDPNRTDYPDVDSDFADDRRKEVVEYAQEKYGLSRVANVANHIKYRGRRALVDIARAHQLPPNAFDAIGKKCEIRIETDSAVDDSIADVVDNYRNEPEVARLLELFGSHIEEAIALEGSQHSMGIHAGGLIVSSSEISSICALYNKTSGTGRYKKAVSVIPYEKRDAEHLGFIKIDLLGLTTMGMLGISRDLMGMSLDDMYGLFYSMSESEKKKMLQLFQKDDLTGIFQYEGGTTRQVTRDVRPATFDELAACNALSRPGPFYGGQTRDYIAVKNGEIEWKKLGKGFDEHVAETYGQIVYQEQIMRILRDYAGFSTEKVLKVRKIIGKKLGEFQFAELWNEFKDGCVSRGATEDDAERVWRGITTAAGYAFNVAHAYSYALIAWWQAYLKINYPRAFYVGVLSKNGDGKNDMVHRTEILKDAVAHNITIAPFELDQCKASWSIDEINDNSIRFGFSQIPGIGEGTAKDLEASRSKDWTELINVDGIGENSIVKMIEFCLSDDPMGVHFVEKQLGILRNQIEHGDFSNYGVPALHHFLDSGVLRKPMETHSWAAFAGYAANIIYRDEIQLIRAKTGQTVEQIRRELSDPYKTKKATIFAYDEFGEVALRISRWSFDSLSADLERIKHNHSIIMAYGKVYADRPGAIQISRLWVLEPD